MHIRRFPSFCAVVQWSIHENDCRGSLCRSCDWLEMSDVVHDRNECIGGLCMLYILCVMCEDEYSSAYTVDIDGDYAMVISQGITIGYFASTDMRTFSMWFFRCVSMMTAMRRSRDLSGGGGRGTRSQG